MSAYAGEAWPGERPRLVRWAQQRLLGPIGERAVALDWHALEVSRDLDGKQGWRLGGPRIRDQERRVLAMRMQEAGVTGDAAANPLWRRGWLKGVGMAVLASAVDQFGADYKHGVAYFVDDGRGDSHWTAGVLPGEFGTATLDGRDYRTVIMRVGSGDPIAAPVLINQSTSEVRFPFGTMGKILPEQLHIVGGLAISKLVKTAEFSNAPIV